MHHSSVRLLIVIDLVLLLSYDYSSDAAKSKSAKKKKTTAAPSCSWVDPSSRLEKAFAAATGEADFVGSEKEGTLSFLTFLLFSVLSTLLKTSFPFFQCCTLETPLKEAFPLISSGRGTPSPSVWCWAVWSTKRFWRSPRPPRQRLPSRVLHLLRQHPVLP
jgi:hypothetical protein